MKRTGPYKEMGTAFVSENGFKEDTVNKFAGPEFPAFPIRVMLQIMFKTLAKQKYAEVAKEWGCNKPIDYKPWE